MRTAFVDVPACIGIVEVCPVVFLSRYAGLLKPEWGKVGRTHLYTVLSLYRTFKTSRGCEVGPVAPDRRLLDHKLLPQHRKRCRQTNVFNSKENLVDHP